MQKKYKISVVVLTVLVLCILTTNLVLGSGPSVSVEKEADDPLAADLAIELEKLKDLTPVTHEEAEEKIYPFRNRFLLWTRDGAHIMWGFYGNGRFVGTDNLRKRCWGIYGKGVFAGFYDGEFFWGRYHNGTWRAQYLFGLKYASGSFILFPGITSAENIP